MTTNLAALARLAEEHGLEVTPLEQVDPRAAARVPLDFQIENRILIFGTEGEGRTARMLVAIADPQHQEIVDELRFQMQLSMRVFLAPAQAMASAWTQLRQGGGPLLRAPVAAALDVADPDGADQEEVFEPEFLDEEEETSLPHAPMHSAATLQAAAQAGQGASAGGVVTMSEVSPSFALPSEWDAATPVPPGQRVAQLGAHASSREADSDGSPRHGSPPLGSAATPSETLAHANQGALNPHALSAREVPVLPPEWSGADRESVSTLTPLTGSGPGLPSAWDGPTTPMRPPAAEASASALPLEWESGHGLPAEWVMPASQVEPRGEATSAPALPEIWEAASASLPVETEAQDPFSELLVEPLAPRIGEVLAPRAGIEASSTGLDAQAPVAAASADVREPPQMEAPAPTGEAVMDAAFRDPAPGGDNPDRRVSLDGVATAAALETDTVDTDWARELLPDGPPPPPEELPGTPVPPSAILTRSGADRLRSAAPGASRPGRLELTDADLDVLDGIERLASGGDEALEAEKVRPARMVATLVRLLMRKGVIDELEFLDELSRK